MLISNMATDLLQRCDRNHDGRIDRPAPNTPYERDELVFEDRDVGGLWTIAPLAQALGDAPLTRATLEAHIKRFDASGDGQLNDAEYTAFRKASLQRIYRPGNLLDGIRRWLDGLRG